MQYLSVLACILGHWPKCWQIRKTELVTTMESCCSPCLCLVCSWFWSTVLKVTFFYFFWEQVKIFLSAPKLILTYPVISFSWVFIRHKMIWYAEYFIRLYWCDCFSLLEYHLVERLNLRIKDKSNKVATLMHSN